MAGSAQGIRCYKPYSYRDVSIWYFHETAMLYHVRQQWQLYHVRQKGIPTSKDHIGSGMYFQMSNNNSVIYTDFLSLPALTTSDRGNVYTCEVTINNPNINVSNNSIGSFELDFASKILT